VNSFSEINSLDRDILQKKFFELQSWCYIKIYDYWNKKFLQAVWVPTSVWFL
jgi:hypothetical protein